MVFINFKNMNKTLNIILIKKTKNFLNTYYDSCISLLKISNNNEQILGRIKDSEEITNIEFDINL